MVATSAAELVANAKAVRARLFAPPNAVVDRGINLRAPKQPAPAPQIRPPRIIWIPHKVRISDVLQLVADYYHIDVVQLTSSKRTASLQQMRNICGWLAHEVLGRDYSEIARTMNRRSHRTVIRATIKLYEDMKLDEGLAYDVAELELRVEALSDLLIAARPAPDPVMELAKKKSVAISRVIQLTAAFYKTSVDHLIGSSRVTRIAKARHVACYLARALLGRGPAEIGRMINHDHSTVSWAFDRIATRLQVDSELFYDIEMLKQQILNDNRGGA